MTESTEFDVYNDDGFDEAFADLINGLEDVVASASPTENAFGHVNKVDAFVANTETNMPPGDLSDHGYKLSRETVRELTDRIQATSVSPYNRFRSQRRMLSVSSAIAQQLNSGY